MKTGYKIILVSLLLILNTPALAVLDHFASASTCDNKEKDVRIDIDWKKNIMRINGAEARKIVLAGTYGKKEVAISDNYISTDGNYSYFYVVSSAEGDFIDIRNAATNQRVFNAQLFCRNEA